MNKKLIWPKKKFFCFIVLLWVFYLLVCHLYNFVVCATPFYRLYAHTLFNTWLILVYFTNHYFNIIICVSWEYCHGSYVVLPSTQINMWGVPLIASKRSSARCGRTSSAASSPALSSEPSFKYWMPFTWCGTDLQSRGSAAAPPWYISRVSLVPVNTSESSTDGGKGGVSDTTEEEVAEEDVEEYFGGWMLEDKERLVTEAQHVSIRLHEEGGRVTEASSLSGSESSSWLSDITALSVLNVASMPPRSFDSPKDNVPVDESESSLSVFLATLQTGFTSTVSFGLVIHLAAW